MAKNRIVELSLDSSAFDTSSLRVRAVEGREVIGRLFDFWIDVVALEAEGLDTSVWEGASASLVFERNGVEERRIPGMLAEVEDQLVSEVEFRVIRVRLVPRAHRLTLVETQEVFVDTTIPDLITKKVGLVGLGDAVETRLTGKYPVREIVIQHAETDLAFVSRLSEHLGISLFFEESDGQDKLILTDHIAGFGHAQGFETLQFQPRGEHADVYRLSQTRRVGPTNFSIRDYNYRTPDLSLVATQEGQGYGGGVDEFGANAKTPDESQALVKARADGSQSIQLTFAGTSDLPAVRAGARYTIEGHPILHDVDILITEVTHRAVQVVLATGGAGEQHYENTFSGVPSTFDYRPPRITPKPRMAGVYSAITEAQPGSTGKYANIDPNGRYTVRFLFDSASGVRKTSHPIRMAQPHAGPDGGLHFPIRPGAEVLVAFMNGDPDRPILIGAVPNMATPAVSVLNSQTVNRIRTASGITIDMGDGT